MGINSGFDNIMRFNFKGSGTFRINNTINTNFNAPSDTSGLFVVDRENQQLSLTWQGQLLKSVISITPNGLPDEEFYLLCQNLGGSPNSHSSANMAMAFAGANSKLLAPAVTQFTEDYLASVRQYYGLPSLTPSTQRSTAITKEDINSVIDIIKGYETKEVNGELVILDLFAMLDTGDVSWDTNGLLTGVKSTDPIYGWDVRYEDMKQGFKNPVEGIIEWKYPTAIDSIALWTGNNLQDTSAWFDFYGSNDLANWTPLTGKINFSFLRRFKHIKSLNNSKFRYFKAVRNTIDVNGQTGSVAHNFMKIIPLVSKMNI